MKGFLVVGITLFGAACGSEIEPLATAEPGVVFTYPANRQLDVPLGSRIVVTFSDSVVASALGPCTGSTGAFCLLGPTGLVDAEPVVSEDGRTVSFEAPPLEAGASYDVIVRSELAPFATNLPQGSLVRFTTRQSLPRSAAPALVAVNGAPPDTPDAFRPLVETSTIRLVFSEPIDTRTLALAPNAIELLDPDGVGVPATITGRGIHVAIDPVDDLAPNTTYELRVGGGALRDLGNQAVAGTAVMLTTHDSHAATPIRQVLRVRQDGDPGPAASRAGVPSNEIVIDKPLIGREVTRALPAVIAAEIGDPTALPELGHPLAFTIRRGQRLTLSGMDIKLGSVIPTGLSTGDITIEFLTDANGRMYRNPFQDAEQRPENLRSPLYVDLTMDVAIYAADPTGTAVMTQTVYGIQATGTVIATDGVLAIETVASMELGLLGATQAPSNFVLEFITDLGAPVPTDTEAPSLIASEPIDGTQTHQPGDGIDLVFSEPIDLAQARTGGIVLKTAAGQQVQAVIESAGAGVVIRPLIRMLYSTSFQVAMTGVRDVAGNVMPDRTLSFSTPTLISTGVPPMLTSIHPGAPCALTATGNGTGGRCTGGKGGDDLYQPFELAANEPIEATFTHPLNANTLVLGGSVRVEATDGGVTAVPGVLVRRDRGFSFVPDRPWEAGKHYRLTLISGGNNSCDAGEICSLLSGGHPPSFDALAGAGDGEGGGPNLVIDFIGAAATGDVYMVVETAPSTDANGNGIVDAAEDKRDENRAALLVAGSGGDISGARFDMTDCIPGGSVNGCMYVDGAMPVAMSTLAHDCELPDGTFAPDCIPVRLSPQAMFGTSLRLTATVLLDITTDTQTNVLRIREPEGGVRGFIIDGGDGLPKMVARLELYMDSPDMEILFLDLADHDVRSKPIDMLLEGPVNFLPDGRIAISLTNPSDIPVRVNITAPLVEGHVDLLLPSGQMKLQLVSQPPRGGEL